MTRYSCTSIAMFSLYVAPFGIIFGGIENKHFRKGDNAEKRRYGLRNAESLLVIGDTAVE